MKEEMTRYLVHYGGKQQDEIIEVPASWKITFGPLCPGGRHNNGSSMMAIRLYETKEKQRAVFTGVKSFRQLDTIKIKRKVDVSKQPGRAIADEDMWEEIDTTDIQMSETGGKTHRRDMIDV